MIKSVKLHELVKPAESAFSPPVIIHETYYVWYDTGICRTYYNRIPATVEKWLHGIHPEILDQRVKRGGMIATSLLYTRG